MNQIPKRTESSTRPLTIAAALLAALVVGASAQAPEPNKLAPKSAATTLEGRTLRFSQPPLSAGVLAVKVRDGSAHR